MALRYSASSGGFSSSSLVVCPQVLVLLKLQILGTRKPATAGFLTAQITSTHRRRTKPSTLDHRKHIRHILDHDPGGIGNGIDVVLGIVGHVGTGHQVQVGEGCLDATLNAASFYRACGYAGGAAGDLLCAVGAGPGVYTDG